MTEPFNLSHPNRPIHVGVILMAGVTEVLDIAPIDTIHAITKQFLDPVPDSFVPDHLKAQALDQVHFHWISEAGPSVPSRLTSGMSLLPTDDFKTCPPLDIVLIGAHHSGYNPTETELAFARKAYGECSAFITICQGVEVAVRAGILEGKTATAPREVLAMLKTMSPGTNWVEKRWVSDGKLWTSGTLLNGLDLMRAFAGTVWGKGAGKKGGGGGDGDENDDNLVEHMMRIGGFPDRDVDYRDA